jgi:hypothetical protein
MELSFGLLRSGKSIRIRPHTAIRNEEAAKMEGSSFNVSSDRITRISPRVGALFLEAGIPGLELGRGL